jgi:hypothetical protein
MQNGNANGLATPEVVETSVIERLTQAERRSQIEVAKQYPRQISDFKKRALELATSDENIAAACFYSMPRAGTRIEGPSVRLAEIVASSWGNLRAQARVIDTNDTHVIAEGVVWDLETNVAISIAVQRRITNRNGERYGDDMITVTGNAACAIAFRNAVFKTIPSAYVNQIYVACRKVAIGDQTTIAVKRKQWVDYAAKFGVPIERILESLGRGEVEDLTLDDLADIAGRLTAIKDNEIKTDEAFPVAASTDVDLPAEGRRKFGFQKKTNIQPAREMTAEEIKKATTPSSPLKSPPVDKKADPPVETSEGPAGTMTVEGVKDPPLRSRDFGVGIAKGMIAACVTVADLDRLIDGDERKSVFKAHGERYQELQAAEAKSQMGGDGGPPVETKPEPPADEPPPPTDKDLGF